MIMTKRKKLLHFNAHLRNKNSCNVQSAPAIQVHWPFQHRHWQQHAHRCLLCPFRPAEPNTQAGEVADRPGLELRRPPLGTLFIMLASGPLRHHQSTSRKCHPVLLLNSMIQSPAHRTPFLSDRRRATLVSVDPCGVHESCLPLSSPCAQSELICAFSFLASGCVSLSTVGPAT